MRTNRKLLEHRPIKITNHYLLHPEGSVLIEFGNTKVICTATVEEEVPPFLKKTGTGWVTAEYGMLPGATEERTRRERQKIGGRTHEIQRLIGRSLRAIVDLTQFGERSIFIDCDVIQADGGTRTAAITGSFVALAEAFKKLKEKRIISKLPLKDYVAAMSVGVVQGQIYLDLEYSEDSGADVDMNLVMTGSAKLVEVQGTAEKVPFELSQLHSMIDAGWNGIQSLIQIQKSLVHIS